MVYFYYLQKSGQIYGTSFSPRENTSDVAKSTDMLYNVDKVLHEIFHFFQILRGNEYMGRGISWYVRITVSTL